MCFRALAFARINAFFWRHSRGTLALSELPPSGGRDALPDALPRDPRQDVRWLSSGAAPLIVDAFRRVRRGTSTDVLVDDRTSGRVISGNILHRKSNE